jgi:hypothetical protein
MDQVASRAGAPSLLVAVFDTYTQSACQTDAFTHDFHIFATD